MQPLTFEEVKELIAQLDKPSIEFDLSIAGQSARFKSCMDGLKKYADSVNQWDIASSEKKLKRNNGVYKMHEPLLIYGETGTGKQFLVRKLASLLKLSSRRGEFNTFNCAKAINSGTVYSELFGHEKGSFTSSIKDKKGIFANSDKRILFFDEFQSLPTTLQAQLNEAIEYGSVTSIGGDKNNKDLDIIVVLASNRLFSELLKDNLLNEDFYYRIETFTINVPPLRERREDIPALIQRFLQNECDFWNMTLTIKENFTLDAIYKLVNHYWRGNIRELRNKIIKLFNEYLRYNPNFIIEPVHLSLNNEPNQIFSPQIQNSFPDGVNSDKPTDPLNDDALLHLYQIKCVEGNSSKAELARELGLDPDRLRKKLLRLGIEKSSPGGRGKARPSRRS